MMAYAQRPRVLTVPAVLALSACAAVGLVAAVHPGIAVVAAGGAAAALLSLRWRAGVFVLLAVLPFAGIPAMLAGATGLAARDALVVLPLYAAFALKVTRSREPLAPPVGLALAALGAFAALAAAHAPLAPTPLTAAIGAKVWLAYVPMLAIGYWFVRERRDFTTMLKLTALLALVPAAIGLCEFAYAATRGDYGPFEVLYGGLPTSGSQRFVVVTTGDAYVKVPRVLSTFTGVTQYFSFMLVAFACALSLALSQRSGRWGACSALLAAAAVASGARAAYIFVPALALLALLLTGARNVRVAGIGGLAGMAVLALTLAAGGPFAVLRELPAHIAVTLHTGWSELRDSFTLLGHGTGWDTNAALRYGGAAHRRYVENWYAKAMLELGVAGMAAITTALAALIWSAVRVLPRLDAESRRAAAPLCALLAVIAVALFKGPYIDLDPLNVYFWLLAGALFGLYRASLEGGAR